MRINGAIVDLANAILLSDYLEQNNFDISKIAVEINGTIVAKKNYKDTMLHNDDTIEVVSFVGGG